MTRNVLYHLHLHGFSSKCSARICLRCRVGNENRYGDRETQRRCWSAFCWGVAYWTGSVCSDVLFLRSIYVERNRVSVSYIYFPIYRDIPNNNIVSALFLNGIPCRGFGCSYHYYGANRHRVPFAGSSGKACRIGPGTLRRSVWFRNVMLSHSCSFSKEIKIII